MTIKTRNAIIRYIQEATKGVLEPYLRVTPNIEVLGTSKDGLYANIEIFSSGGFRYDFIHIFGLEDILNSNESVEEGLHDVKNYIDSRIEDFIEFFIKDPIRWAYPVVNAIEDHLLNVVAAINDIEETLNAELCCGMSGHYYIKLHDIAGQEAGVLAPVNIKRLYEGVFHTSIVQSFEFLTTWIVDAFCNMYGCTFDEAFKDNAFIEEYYNKQSLVLD